MPADGPAPRGRPGEPGLRFLADALRYYMEFHSRYDGFFGAFIHDPLALAVALDPGLARARSRDRGGGAGRPPHDRRDGRPTGGGRGAGHPTCDVVVEADVAAFFERFIERVGALAARSRECGTLESTCAGGASRGAAPVEKERWMDWVSRQFSTRVIALMPVAIAVNIVLGYIVQTILKPPIYLDSIGTILVGVLAGPIAGARDRRAVEPHLAVRAGHRRRHDRPVRDHRRRHRAPRRALGDARRLPASPGRRGPALGPDRARDRDHRDPRLAHVHDPDLHRPERGRIPRLGLPRDRRHRGRSPPWRSSRSSTRGATRPGRGSRCPEPITGIVAAIVSAPIAAYVFGGVTGSGTDLIVAALRQGGADVLNATLGQGLFSDPIDKTITSFVVYLILLGLSPRFLARFPLGDRLVPAERSRPAAADGTIAGRVSAAPARRPGRVLPAFVARPPTGPYRSLNPTTKLVIAVARRSSRSGCAAGPGPLVGPGGRPRARGAAGVLRRAAAAARHDPPRRSILLVNTFLTRATDPSGRSGHSEPTWTGLREALQATLRGAGVRGLGRPARPDDTTPSWWWTLRPGGRAPAHVRRRRGLDRPGHAGPGGHHHGRTAGPRPGYGGRALAAGPGHRAHAGPHILGAINEVEERSMALEARGFTRPGRRTVLWRTADSPAPAGAALAARRRTVVALASSRRWWSGCRDPALEAVSYRYAGARRAACTTWTWSWPAARWWASWAPPRRARPRCASCSPAWRRAPSGARSRDGCWSTART